MHLQTMLTVMAIYLAWRRQAGGPDRERNAVRRDFLLIKTLGLVCREWRTLSKELLRDHAQTAWQLAGHNDGDAVLVENLRMQHLSALRLAGIDDPSDANASWGAYWQHRHETRRILLCTCPDVDFLDVHLLDIGQEEQRVLTCSRQHIIADVVVHSPAAFVMPKPDHCLLFLNYSQGFEDKWTFDASRARRLGYAHLGRSFPFLVDMWPDVNADTKLALFRVAIGFTFSLPYYDMTPDGTFVFDVASKPDERPPPAPLPRASSHPEWEGRKETRMGFMIAMGTTRDFALFRKCLQHTEDSFWTPPGSPARTTCSPTPAGSASPALMDEALAGLLALGAEGGTQEQGNDATQEVEQDVMQEGNDATPEQDVMQEVEQDGDATSVASWSSEDGLIRVRPPDALAFAPLAAWWDRFRHTLDLVPHEKIVGWWGVERDVDYDWDGRVV